MMTLPLILNELPQLKRKAEVPAPTAMAPQQMYLDEKTIATQKQDATSALVNQATVQANMLKHQCAGCLYVVESKWPHWNSRRQDRTPLQSI